MCLQEQAATCALWWCTALHCRCGWQPRCVAGAAPLNQCDPAWLAGCCRDSVRARLAPGDFLEVYMRIPIEVGRGKVPLLTSPSCQPFLPAPLASLLLLLHTPPLPTPVPTTPAMPDATGWRPPAPSVLGAGPQGAVQGGTRRVSLYPCPPQSPPPPLLLPPFSCARGGTPSEYRFERCSQAPNAKHQGLQWAVQGGPTPLAQPSHTLHSPQTHTTLLFSCARSGTPRGCTRRPAPAR